MADAFTRALGPMMASHPHPLPEPRFAVGDVVRLKSGGIAMTVDEPQGDLLIRCIWFDERHLLCKQRFSAAMLRREDEPKLAQLPEGVLADKEDKAFHVGRNDGLDLAATMVEEATDHESRWGVATRIRAQRT